jgi:hypothetical protein
VRCCVHSTGALYEQHPTRLRSTILVRFINSESLEFRKKEG